MSKPALTSTDLNSMTLADLALALSNRVDDLTLEQGRLKKSITDLMKAVERGQLVSVKYAVNRLNVSAKCVYNAIARKRLVGFRVIDGRYVITKHSVERYLATRGPARGRKRSTSPIDEST